MAENPQDEFQRKLKKKIAKRVKKAKKIRIQSKNTSGFYFLGFLGSAIYFVSHATGFWDGVLGLLKSIVWPAFLVYQAFASLLGN